jgi:thioredoxin reductase
MSWLVLSGLVLALGLAFLATVSRKNELARMRRGLEQRERNAAAGPDAVLRHPVVDLSRCLGCGTCVASCPEGDVLALVHGQALVVNAARCVGHAACERECPVGAITITVANLAERRDVPVVTAALESASAPGLFLAGEVTAHALVKTAVEQGVAAVGEIARRLQHSGAVPGEHELCIVGAGPAGLAAALEATRLGLGFVVLEQESGPGGTVARYPRRKLVLTQPLTLPLHGPLGGGRTEFTKEELVALWLRLAREHALPIHAGVEYLGCERSAHGSFVVATSAGAVLAQHVLLALGRRGSPRKLCVPGEELPKVAYGLLDARSYAHRRALVVGGGDAAAETALALAEQPGNHVVLSYRRDAFFRVRPRNVERLDAAAAEGRLVLALGSEVREITADAVVLEHGREGARHAERLANDEVFVLAGGTAPLERLERSGVSCDPELRAAPAAPAYEQGTGLVRALGAGFVLALGGLLFAAWNADYYTLPIEARPAAAKHAVLRLRVVEVRRHRDDRLLDLVAEVVLGGLLHFLEHHRRDLGWRVALALDLDRGHVAAAGENLVWDAPGFIRNLRHAASHEALDRKDCICGVGDGLALRDRANEALAILREAHDRGGRAATLRIRDDDRVASLHDGHDGIGRAEVNPDDFVCHCQRCWF